MTSGIYWIRNKNNGKFYIGSSIDVEQRIKKHKKELTKGVHPNRPLQNSWNKHGKDAFKFEVLEETRPEERRKIEQWYLDNTRCLDKKYGYNINKNVGEHPSPYRDKQQRPVIQYDVNGQFVARYDSLISASRAIGKKKFKISSVIHGHRRTAYGYVWKFEGEPFHLKPIKENTGVFRKGENRYPMSQFNRDQISIKVSKPVIQMTNSGEELQRYKNARQANEETGVSFTKISLVCNGKRNTAGGFKWRFA